MSLIRCGALWSFCALVCCGVAGAAGPANIAWHHNVQQAWSIAVQSRRPLLVFVTHDECAYCIKMKGGTYAHPAVAAAVSAGYVPLVLHGGDDLAILKDLHVESYPTTFIISTSAVIVDRMEGYVSPLAFYARLAGLARGTRVVSYAQH